VGRAPGDIGSAGRAVTVGGGDPGADIGPTVTVSTDTS
jgi:hypothetical protein